MDVGSLVLLTSEEHHGCTYVYQQVHLKQVCPLIGPHDFRPFLGTADLTLCLIYTVALLLILFPSL